MTMHFGGGLGWLSRKYGFAADSLLRVDAVTAYGELVTASADQHPDLFNLETAIPRPSGFALTRLPMGRA